MKMERKNKNKETSHEDAFQIIQLNEPPEQWSPLTVSKCSTTALYNSAMDPHFLFAHSRAMSEAFPVNQTTTHNNGSNVSSIPDDGLGELLLFCRSKISSFMSDLSTFNILLLMQF